jgi:hypothetical protein
MRWRSANDLVAAIDQSINILFAGTRPAAIYRSRTADGGGRNWQSTSPASARSAYPS